MPAAFIALGANLPGPAGDPIATLAEAATRLTTLGTIAARSSLYRTAPVGFSDQPDFFNAVLELNTSLDPHPLLDNLLAIERSLGRDRSSAIPNGPRTIDLDLLLYGDTVIDTPTLQLPHPRLAQRAFVLVPLNEIAPAAIDPCSGLTVGELLQGLFPHFPNVPDSEKNSINRVDSPIWHRALPPGSPDPARAIDTHHQS